MAIGLVIRFGAGPGRGRVTAGGGKGACVSLDLAGSKREGGDRASLTGGGGWAWFGAGGEDWLGGRDILGGR